MPIHRPVAQVRAIPRDKPVGHLDLDAMPPRGAVGDLVQQFLELRGAGRDAFAALEPVPHGVGPTVADQHAQGGSIGGRAVKPRGQMRRKGGESVARFGQGLAHRRLGVVLRDHARADKARERRRAGRQCGGIIAIRAAAFSWESGVSSVIAPDIGSRAPDQKDAGQNKPHPGDAADVQRLARHAAGR